MRAHDVFEATLDVTEKHIYGSGGTSICYQFDVQAFDIGFGIWCGQLITRARTYTELCSLTCTSVRRVRRLKRTGADVVSHGEEVVLISEKFEAGTTVKAELAVTHPGSYILRWDNTHSRMRGKQIQCELTAPPSLFLSAPVR